MQWDVFISHASEDKDSFVRPLASELRENGLRVWYDEFSLRLGDSLNESINKGLSGSRFGIVILSRAFFEKRWTKNELDGLVAREMQEGKVILPLWHGVDHADVCTYSPMLADRVAVQTTQGVSHAVSRILEIVQPLPSWVLVSQERSLNNLRHEILSPIDGILAHVEWMERHISESTNLAEWNSDRIRIKIEDIKQNARLIEMFVASMGSWDAWTPLKPRQISLDKSIQKCIDLLLNETRRRAITIDVQIPTSLHINGDELALLRAFYSLIRNALQYSDPNEEHKYVRIVSVEDPNHVVLRFEDNGIGLIRGEEEIIFQMFSRGSHASRVFPEGSGLGLYYTRAVIRSHGGSISIDRSNVAKPTVVVVRLPKSG